MDHARTQNIIYLSEHQKRRLGGFKAEIDAINANVAVLNDRARAFQAGAEAMLATILELNGVPDDARYMLNDDSTALVPKIDGKE